MLFAKLTGEGEDPCSWTEVTLRELKAFLGLLVAMSTQQLSSLQDYWFTDWILGVPAFAKVMPRNSFFGNMEQHPFSRELQNGEAWR